MYAYRQGRMGKARAPSGGVDRAEAGRGGLRGSVNTGEQPSQKKRENHGTQDSRVVPHRGTNWAALRLTAQIERDAVLSEPYGRG